MACSHPFLCHWASVRWKHSDQIDQGRTEDRAEKVAPRLHGPLELGEVVHLGVYRSPDSFFHRCERIRNLGKLDLAQNEDIDVTGVCQRASGQRTVDSGVADLADERRQGGAKQIGCAHRLFQEGPEGGENRGRPIRLVKDLPATTVGVYQSDAFQFSKLALRRACAGTSQAREFPQVKGLVLSSE
jgi:hypothetical protein